MWIRNLKIKAFNTSFCINMRHHLMMWRCHERKWRKIYKSHDDDFRFKYGLNRTFKSRVVMMIEIINGLDTHTQAKKGSTDKSVPQMQIISLLNSQ